MTTHTLIELLAVVGAAALVGAAVWFAQRTRLWLLLLQRYRAGTHVVPDWVAIQYAHDDIESLRDELAYAWFPPPGVEEAAAPIHLPMGMVTTLAWLGQAQQSLYDLMVLGGFDPDNDDYLGDSGDHVDRRQDALMREESASASAWSARGWATRDTDPDADADADDDDDDPSDGPTDPAIHH